MRRVVYTITLCLLFLSLSTVSNASFSEFAGRWKNVNVNTRGITTLDIKVQGKNVTVHAWGKCHPADCDWGAVRATAYAPNVSSDIVKTAKVLTAEFRTSFSRTLLVIKARRNKLDVESYTRFTDGSNRSDYWNVYEFRRSRVAASRLVEDCISFNPISARVAKINNRWKIVDGNQWLFDFGSNKREAYEALRIIKFYKMNQSCFVGRPGPSFEYMLVSGRAPSGSIRREDCIAFHPNRIAVKKINGRWKIVEGNIWLFDFGNNKDEAEQAYRIIKKYGFRYSCFVGRPHASFKYLRK